MKRRHRAPLAFCAIIGAVISIGLVASAGSLGAAAVGIVVVGYFVIGGVHIVRHKADPNKRDKWIDMQNRTRRW